MSYRMPDSCKNLNCTMLTRAGLRVILPTTSSRWYLRVTLPLGLCRRRCQTRSAPTRGQRSDRCCTYSIYANDMPLYADDANIVQYADDTQVLVSGRPGDIGAIIGSMERNLSQLSNWFGKNGMKINAHKTQLIVLGTRQNIRQLPAVSIKFMGATVSGSPAVRNLGVVFDQCMTFTAHTDDAVRRCTGILIGLSHCRHALPHSTL